MVTEFLTQVFAIYFIVISLALYMYPRQVEAAARDILASPGQSFFTALVTLILGALLVVAHNIWVWGFPVVITILSWMTLIKGVARLLLPEQVNRFALWVYERWNLQLAAVVWLLVGCYFAYVGFM